MSELLVGEAICVLLDYRLSHHDIADIEGHRQLQRTVERMIRDGK